MYSFSRDYKFNQNTFKYVIVPDIELIYNLIMYGVCAYYCYMNINDEQ